MKYWINKLSISIFKLVFTFAIIYLSGITYGQIQTCSPTFQEIYDFEVGDVFQYKYIENDFTGVGDGTWIKHQKNTVVDKAVSGDSLIYKMESKVYSYWPAPSDAPFDRFGEYSDSFSKTIRYRNADTYFLNSCDSQMIKFNFQIEFGDENFEYFTRIMLQQSDGLAEKHIGGHNNQYVMDENDSLIQEENIIFERTYAAGLGLKRHYEFYGEYSYLKELQGYVKDGDTSGVVWPDENYIVSIEKQRFDQHSIQIEPSYVPDNGILSIRSNKPIDDIQVLSVSGKKYYFERIAENKIKINALPHGCYIITLRIGDHIVSKKIMK